MSKPVTHQFTSRPGFSPGSTITGTLCGRETMLADGNNAGNGAEVTCKLCLKLLAAQAKRQASK